MGGEGGVGRGGRWKLSEDSPSVFTDPTEHLFGAIQGQLAGHHPTGIEVEHAFGIAVEGVDTGSEGGQSEEADHDSVEDGEDRHEVPWFSSYKGRRGRVWRSCERVLSSVKTGMKTAWAGVNGVGTVRG